MGSTPDANPNVGSELLKSLVPALTAIIGGLWVAYTYVENQRQAREQEVAQSRKDNITRLIEAQKPFASVQLQLFMEAGKVAGQLATFDKTGERWSENSEWKGYYTRFYQLFYTELSIVEDQQIKEAMQNFSAQLQKITREAYKVDEDDKLKQLAYQLARHIRASIEETWKVGLSPLDEGKDK
jgi:hypothetical protein